jgi:nitrite reductase/ring-hydroxylating ferredoxin subunit
MGLLAKKGAADWVRVAGEDDLASSGDCREVRHGGKEYALFRLDDGLYCTQASCSHEYSALCEGMVDGCEVFCARHGSRFDIRSGEALSPPADRALETFPVKVEDGGVWIFV